MSMPDEIPSPPDADTSAAASPQPSPSEPAGQQGAASAQHTSGLAITAFVLSLIFFIPFLTPLLAAGAIVIGIIALVKIKHHKEFAGRGFAIAGIIIAVVVLIIHIIGLILIINAMSAFTEEFGGVIESMGQLEEDVKLFAQLPMEEGYERCLREPPAFIEAVGQQYPERGLDAAEFQQSFCFGMIISLHAEQVRPENDNFCEQMGAPEMQTYCTTIFSRDERRCDELGPQAQECKELLAQLDEAERTPFS